MCITCIAIPVAMTLPLLLTGIYHGDIDIFQVIRDHYDLFILLGTALTGYGLTLWQITKI